MRAREIEQTLAALRREFDQAFVAPPARERAAVVDLVTLSAGGHRYAVRLADLAGVHRDWRVVPIASDAPNLLGIAASRGSIMAVYDLAALLGHPAERAPRWFFTLRSPGVALAFAILQGHARVDPGAIVSRADGSAGGSGVVTVFGASHALIDVASVVDQVERRGQAGSAKER